MQVTAQKRMKICMGCSIRTKQLIFNELKIIYE